MVVEKEKDDGEKTFVPRTFSSAVEVADEQEGSDHEGASGQPVSNRVIIAAVAMTVVGLFCFLLSAGFSGGSAELSKADQKQIYQLRDQIRTAQIESESLPNAKEGERYLTRSLEAADDVAQIQNDYRYLAPRAAQADGKLESSWTASGRRNLTPYFDPTTDAELLGPWYMLESDADVVEGTGLSTAFDSGFEWQAQVPEAINRDGTVSVTWLARETHPADGKNARVLAWAQADYDTTRQVFSNVRVGTTTTGEDLRMEVEQA